MKITLIRDVFTPKSTTGLLLVGSLFYCYTLEDPPREVKISGKTCIPDGTYEIKLHDSPRFKRKLPWLQDVPGFSYILIHPGNTADDTEGCILVGGIRTQDYVSGSRLAFDPLYAKIEAAITRNERVEIKIISLK